ncbi:MAG: DUF99 family protein [bacterium]
MKRGIRVVGVDDGPVPSGAGRSVFVAATVVRGDGQLDGLLCTRIRRDGWNATERLIQLLCESRFHPQIHAVMLDGIALGGLNVVDIQRLSQRLQRPVLTVVRRRPNRERFRAAVERLPRFEARWRLVERAGEVMAAGPIFCQCAGIGIESARRLIAQTTLQGNLPEPIRLAHLIAGGVVSGESRGRA